MLTALQISEAGQMLADSFRTGEMLTGLGHLTPTDAPSAEAISDAAAVALGLDVIGWKVGCTSEAAMQILKSPGPFAGRVFAGRLYAGDLPAGELHNPMIECEFAFVLGSNLPAREQPYVDVAEVKAATQAVAPAIELVAPRLNNLAGAGYLSLIADHGASGGVVIGEPIAAADLPDLSAVAVSCEIDGAPGGAGSGASILGDPWNSLLWLAEHLRSRGLGLSAGQFVMSGTCTGLDPFPAGATATAHHVGLGDVTVRNTNSAIPTPHG